MSHEKINWRKDLRNNFRDELKRSHGKFCHQKKGRLKIEQKLESRLMESEVIGITLLTFSFGGLAILSY